MKFTVIVHDRHGERIAYKRFESVTAAEQQAEQYKRWNRAECCHIKGPEYEWGWVRGIGGRISEFCY